MIFLILILEQTSTVPVNISKMLRSISQNKTISKSDNLSYLSPEFQDNVKDKISKYIDCILNPISKEEPITLAPVLLLIYFS